MTLEEILLAGILIALIDIMLKDRPSGKLRRNIDRVRNAPRNIFNALKK